MIIEVTSYRWVKCMKMRWKVIRRLIYITKVGFFFLFGEDSVGVRQNYIRSIWYICTCIKRPAPAFFIHLNLNHSCTCKYAYVFDLCNIAGWGGIGRENKIICKVFVFSFRSCSWKKVLSIKSLQKEIQKFYCLLYKHVYRIIMW